MKKVLLALMVMGITTSSAYATYEVHYMNTGAVKNFTPVRFGENAPIGSGPRHDEYTYRVREVKRYNTITESIKNQNNYNINLNVNNKNNKVLPNNASVAMNNDVTTKTETTPKTTKVKSFSPITCNGITYYNQNNPCSL